MIWCQYPKTIHHLSLLFCSQGCQPFCEYQQWSVACHQNQNHDNILDARHLQCKPRRWRLQFVPTKKSFRIRFSESNDTNLFLSLPCSCQQGGNYTSKHGNLEVEVEVEQRDHGTKKDAKVIPTSAPPGLGGAVASAIATADWGLWNDSEMKQSVVSSSVTSWRNPWDWQKIWRPLNSKYVGFERLKQSHFFRADNRAPAMKRH